MSALPNFLIIGAMKAGTTSLSDALSNHPEVFIPATKEPNSLAEATIETPEGVAAYERLFRPGQDRSARGEASTMYTKRHLKTGTAARARQLLGPDLKLVYLVRDPLARAVSHANHELGSPRGVTVADLNPVRPDLGIVQAGRYAFQLEPWFAEFPLENFLIIDFAELIADPAAVLQRVCEHIGVDPALAPTTLTKSNAREDARITGGLIRRLVLDASWYRNHVQERLPMMVRRRLKRSLSRPSTAPTIISDDLTLLDGVEEAWTTDLARLHELTGVVVVRR